MFECDNCGRKGFKSASGLKRHINGCKVEPIIEEVSNEVEVNVEQSDRVRRRLAKLRDSHRNCQDALTKYNLECEIREIEGINN